MNMMSDITLWDAGPVKIYDDGKGNYKLQICNRESNVLFWDTAEEAYIVNQQETEVRNE